MIKAGIIYFLLFNSVWAQSLSPAAKVWEYEPTDRIFWTEILQLNTNKKYLAMVELADQKVKGSKKESLDFSEARLAQLIGLSGLGLTFTATKMASEIIKSRPATNLAIRALMEVEEIVKTNPVDEDEVFGELIWDQDDSVGLGPTMDFVNFYNGLFNELHGYPQWSENNFKKLSVGSYWDYRYKYYLALLDVKKNQIDSAIEKFASLASNPAANENIKADAAHQYARLLFEKKDFQQAYKVYKGVTLNPRERGLILLERAWSKYYEKNYSKAIGLLTALEAPAFDRARSPEPYILKMLIYKELCNYDAVFAVQKEYKKRFTKSLEVIKNRKDLRKDPIIVSLASLDRRIGNWVNYLNSIKEEKKSLKQLSLSGFTFSKELNALYDSKIKEVYEKLDWLLADKSRVIAKEIIQWDEQISFLDYQTRVDSLRIARSFGEKDYKTEEVSHIAFDKIYWIFKGEFWLDEIEKLKVLVESKCNVRAPSSSRGRK